MRALSLLVALCCTSPATAQTAIVKQALEIAADLNSMCRGWSGSDERTDQVCNVRDKSSRLLNSLGYCYGKRGQAGYQMTWHVCTATSLR